MALQGRHALAILGALVALGLAYLALRPAPVAVDVAFVDRGGLRVTVDEEGRTRVRHRYVVAAPVEGRLLRPALLAGDAVREGEPLAHLRPAPLDPRSLATAEARLQSATARLAEAEALVARARAAEQQARRDLDRARRLWEAGTLAPGELERHELEATSRARELEAAHAAREAARFEREAAQAALLASDLRGAAPVDGVCGDEPCLPLPAPITGRVLRVFEESERTLAPGTPVLEIGDPRDLEIVADVLSHDAVRVRPGARVIVEDWGGDDPLEARVRLVEPSGFTKISALGVEEQRVNVIADLVAAPEGLGDGYRVEMRVVIAEVEDALRVPTSAIFRRREDWAVFTVEGGRARVRSVQLGARAAFDAQVLAGLSEGEPVILHPSDQVEDGVRVRPF